MRNLRKIYLSLFLGCLSLSAFAQNWSGSYVGVHVGSRDTDIKHSDDQTAQGLGLPSTENAKSTVSGLYFGYNYQWNQIVFGPEIEFSIGKSKSTAQGVDPTLLLPDEISTCSFCNYEISNSARLRMRLGYVYDDKTLLFLAGGIVRSSFQYKDTDPNFGTYKEKINGSSFGAGGEYIFNNSMSLRAEYIRDQYSDVNFVVGGGTFGINSKPTSDTIRVGLSYKF